jgi:hypothetical protein
MEVFLSVEGAVNEEIKSGWRTTYEGIRTEEDHERVRSQHILLSGFLSHNKRIREEEVIEGF